MMYLIPHEGNTNGDSNFWANEACEIDKVPKSLEEVKELWRKGMVKHGEGEISGLDALLDSIKGAWVINIDTKDIIDGIVANVNPCSDGAAYVCNSLCKMLAANQAIHTIGDPVRR